MAVDGGCGFYWDLPPASMILYDDICIRMDGWMDRF